MPLRTGWRSTASGEMSSSDASSPEWGKSKGSDERATSGSGFKAWSKAASSTSGTSASSKASAILAHSSLRPRPGPATTASLSVLVDDSTLALLGLRGGAAGAGAQWATYPADETNPAGRAVRSGRPLLLGNVRSRIKALLDERTPVYESVASLVVETDGRDPEDIAREIAQALA